MFANPQSILFLIEILETPVWIANTPMVQGISCAVIVKEPRPKAA